MILELILFGVLLALLIADWGLTRSILADGGVEINPVMNLAYKKFGMAGIAAIKLVIAVLVMHWQINGTLPNEAMLFCIALYALTVGHLVRERHKQDPHVRQHASVRLLDPRTFSSLQWVSLALLILGPASLLLGWQSATDRLVQLVTSLVMMAAMTCFAIFVYYPKRDDPNDSQPR